MGAAVAQQSGCRSKGVVYCVGFGPTAYIPLYLGFKGPRRHQLLVGSGKVLKPFATYYLGCFSDHISSLRPFPRDLELVNGGAESLRPWRVSVWLMARVAYP